MPRADFVCAPRLRVRWAEVDMQKIVFNGHYLTYIDTAIAEYWREIGLPYPHGYVERYASDVFLRKATAELVYVNADPSSMRAVPLPEELRERVRRYERTAPQACFGWRISRL